MSIILVRYNELGLKSPKVRRRFQRKLVENIERQFMDENIECIIDSLWGRILVHTSEIDPGVEILTRIFGISSVSVTEKGTGGLQEIIDSVLEYADVRLNENCTFAVRTRRYGEHDFTSIELAEKLGSALLDKYGNRGIKVKLKGPDVEIFVEVRNNDFYLFSDKQQGVGGLPLGTQGRVLGIYENANSFIAWWLIMKRGATVIPIYALNGPVTDINEPTDQIDDPDFKSNFSVLQKWSPGLKLRLYYGKDERSGTAKEGTDPAIMNYLKIMNELSRRYKVDGIVSGMGMDEFEKELDVIEGKNISDFPIFLPLVGLEDLEISKLNDCIFG